MTVLTLFMLMQIPGPRAFSVVQKPWGWAHISVQKPRGAQGDGNITGQIDTCIRTIRNGNNGDGRTSGRKEDAIMTQFSECIWYVFSQTLFNRKDQEDIHPFSVVVPNCA